jgi:hypothetical protein
MHFRAYTSHSYCYFFFTYFGFPHSFFFFSFVIKIQGNDGEDVITNLRNGAAVENAVSIMQERGFSNPRRSRHRLTPGTVKFAAFHVLSLEGSKGLTILEVADKIQVIL